MWSRSMNAAGKEIDRYIYLYSAYKSKESLVTTRRYLVKHV